MLRLVRNNLRGVAGLEAFTRFLKQRYEKIDIIINNACETIRRPAGFNRPAVLEEHSLYKDANKLHHSFLTGGKAYEALRPKMHSAPRPPTFMTNKNHTHLGLESSVPNASVEATASEAIVLTGDGISDDVHIPTSSLATENVSNGMAMTRQLKPFLWRRRGCI
jgi:hypothetical protein